MARSAAPENALAELDRAIEVVAGRPATAEVRGRFAKYLALLTTWNRTHHLTAYRTPRDVVRGLFVDSMLFLPLLPPRPHRLADIGSGPGIPGVPLRIVEPGLSITLVESRRKPVSFLAELKRQLGLADVGVVHGRAGDDDVELTEQFECVVSRGVRVDADLVAIALRYLRPGGRFIATMGPDGDELIDEVPEARVENVSYPAVGLQRRFIVVSK